MNLTPAEPDTPGVVSVADAADEQDVFYRHNRVQVTGKWVCTDDRRFPVQEPHDLRLARPAPSELTITATMFALTTLFAMARLWQDLGTDGWVGALAVLALTVVIAVLGRRQHPRDFVLVADYRGRTVAVACDRSARRLHEIGRAVHRARSAGTD